MSRLFRKLREENANSMVENVIILPLVFIIIYFLILGSFVIHDRATLEAAMKRGSIYAARCISDPNYSTILSKAGNTSGQVDATITSLNSDSFSAVGKNIQPYRYLSLDKSAIETETKAEVSAIIDKTKIPWRKFSSNNVTVDIDNYVIYQKVTVSAKASYPLPQLFGAFGLPTQFDYTVSATTTVNDPDEFIRNVDLVVDIMVDIDKKTGGHISGVAEKISDLGTKMTDFFGNIHN